ncbi:MAG: hypothetical protein HC908_11785, partial [Calothrix sp. SM1_7_51]|nr:hypothetical protein [Calothrix sp. SM1_7_51]
PLERRAPPSRRSQRRRPKSTAKTQTLATITIQNYFRLYEKLAGMTGTAETEALIKDETKATIRCIPLNAPAEAGACIRSGKPSHRRVLFARAY